MIFEGNNEQISRMLKKTEEIRRFFKSSCRKYMGSLHSDDVSEIIFNLAVGCLGRVHGKDLIRPFQLLGCQDNGYQRDSHGGYEKFG